MTAVNSDVGSQKRRIERAGSGELLQDLIKEDPITEGDCLHGHCHH
jgi:hypothetical protein